MSEVQNAAGTVTEMVLQQPPVILHASGALLTADRNTLVIADVHAGKATHFATEGIAIHRRVEQENYWNLSAVLAGRACQEIVFLGDLFHSRMNAEWMRLIDFLEQFPNLRRILVTGNHDQLDQRHYREASFEVYDVLLRPGLHLTHYPCDPPEGLFNVCGHLHPAVRLSSAILPGLRLSCFHLSANRLVLPAFGSFTGHSNARTAPGDVLFAQVNGGLLKIPR